MRTLFGLLMVGTAWAQRFEVASVKPSPQLANGAVTRTSPDTPIRISGNHVAIRGFLFADLVATAYGVKDYQVSGGPDWAMRRSDLWDVDGKAPFDGGPDVEQARAMLQHLLADRFQLTLHHESRQMEVYNLTIAKNGLKKEIETRVAGLGANMQLHLILRLAQNRLDRPLVDKTGLPGTYQMNWDLEQMEKDRAVAPDAAGKTWAVSASLEQLGLRVEAATETMDMLVIERAERPDDLK